MTPFYRFMHTFDDARLVSAGDQNLLGHTALEKLESINMPLYHSIVPFKNQSSLDRLLVLAQFSHKSS